jgi:hypothetical protein
MPFIQVTDFRSEAECGEQPPAANPEEQFLLETQLRPTAIQLARNPSMNGDVRRVIAIYLNFARNRGTLLLVR